MIETVKTTKERLRWLIEQRQTNPSKLSKEAGLKSRGHVGLFLDGRIKELTEEAAEKIARATGASADWLLTGDGDPWRAPPAEPLRAPPATADPVAHGAILAALATAFRGHPSATIEDLDAVRALVTAGHARLIPLDHAPAVLSAWLDGAQSIRASGEPVTIDALSRYLSNLPNAPSRVQH